MGGGGGKRKCNLKDLFSTTVGFANCFSFFFFFFFFLFSHLCLLMSSCVHSVIIYCKFYMDLFLIYLLFLIMSYSFYIRLFFTHIYFSCVHLFILHMSVFALFTFIFFLCSLNYFKYACLSSLIFAFSCSFSHFISIYFSLITFLFLFIYSFYMSVCLSLFISFVSACLFIYNLLSLCNKYSFVN